MVYYPHQENSEIKRVLTDIQRIEKKVSKRPPFWRRRWFLISFLILVLIFGTFGYFSYKISSAFSEISISENSFWRSILSILPFKNSPLAFLLPLSGNKPLQPQKDPDRINVLLLGTRGSRDNGHGDLLSDTIMILSIKKSSNQTALISIPRDLYIKISSYGKKKINNAYVLGEQENRGGGGLILSKEVVSDVTDLYIDHTISADLNAFEELVNILGGLTIWRDRPFVEDKQWWCDENDENCRPFIVPAGQSTLNGEQALFYVRSRFSSSDFDRMRRQQQVFLAIKEKVLGLKILANPKKIFEILNVLKRNIKTDMDITEIRELIDLSKQIDFTHIKRKVFDVSTEGLLYATKINSAYVLLPVGGNFDKVQEVCKNIFD